MLPAKNPRAFATFAFGAFGAFAFAASFAFAAVALPFRPALRAGVAECEEGVGGVLVAIVP